MRVDLKRNNIFDVYDWVKIVGLRSRAAGGMANDGLLRDALVEANWKLDVHYDALLVDEGQDATDTQMRLYKEMLNGTDCSFTFFYDDRQRLYQHGVVSQLQQYGFRVVEKKLVRQQRSLLVLLALAFYLRLHDQETTSQAVESALEIAKRWFLGYFRFFAEKAKRLISKSVSALSKVFGGIVLGSQSTPSTMLKIEEELVDAFELTQVSNSSELVDAILGSIQSVVATGKFSYGDINILLPSHHYGPGLDAKLKDSLRQLFSKMCVARKIPYTYLDSQNGHTYTDHWPPQFEDNRRSADLSLNTVKMMTIHTSKGYDSKLVFVAGIDGIDSSSVRAQLGYVALTRAKSRCAAYFITENESVSALRDVLLLLNQREIKVVA